MQTTPTPPERRKLTIRQRVVKALDGVPFQFAFVGIVAVFARLLLFAYNSRGAYFSDSWDYIFRSRFPAPPSRFHSPFINQLWQLGTLGNANAATVLWFQLALGVCTTLIVFAIVRLFTEKKLAMSWALLCSLLPAQLFAERSYLTETMTSFLIVLTVMCLIFIEPKRSLVSNAGLAVVAFGAAGCMVAVRPALQVAGIVLFASISYRVVRISFGGRNRKIRVARKLASVTVGCLIGVAPCIYLAAWYDAAYKNFSIAPGQAIDLFARWGALVPCSEAAAHEGLVREAVLEVFDQPFSAMPGSGSNVIWSPDSSLHRLMGSPNPQVADEQELKSIAMQAMMSHPLRVVGELAQSIWWQASGPPYVASSLYHNGSQWLHLKTTDDVKRRVADWIDSRQISPNEGVPLLKAVESTTRVPQLFLTLFGLLSLPVWARALRRNRRGDPVVGLPRGLVGAASLVVLASILTTALGGIPSFRYWTPIWPCLAILVLARVVQLVPRARRTETGVPSPRGE